MSRRWRWQAIVDAIVKHAERVADQQRRVAREKPRLRGRGR